MYMNISVAQVEKKPLISIQYELYSIIYLFIYVPSLYSNSSFGNTGPKWLQLG